MKKIDVLPNLVTTGNLLSGVVSIAMTLQGNYAKAALWILIGMIFDFLDGHVARLSRSSTKFGEQYDSLCDFLSFGIAPMVMMYEMSLFRFGRFGLCIAFIYALACALRLARYNSRLDGTTKAYFSGLPSPAAGGLVASLVLSADHVQWFGLDGLSPILMLAVAFLMISNIQYPRLQVLGIIMKRGPFTYFVASAIALGGFVLLGEICLAIVFLFYTLGGLGYGAYVRHHAPSDESLHPGQIRKGSGR